MLNSFERDTIAEVKALLAARKPVPHWQKQMLLDLLKREGLSLSSSAIAQASKDGLNVEGVKAL